MNHHIIIKRKFSLSKDYINIFVKQTKSIDLENTIDNECESFDSCEFKHRNVCLMLIVEKENVSEEDKKYVIDIAKQALIGEVITRNSSSIFLVLIDKSSNKAYYVIPGRYRFTLYNVAFKALKKLLNINKK